jgi:hypothetical protein
MEPKIRSNPKSRLSIGGLPLIFDEKDLQRNSFSKDRPFSETLVEVIPVLSQVQALW